MGKVIITGVDGNFGSYAARSIMKKLDRKVLIFASPDKSALIPFRDEGIQINVVLNRL